MVAADPLKLGGISLGGDQTTRTRRTAVFEWSDDDKIPVAPPPSTEAPPRSTRAEEQAKRSEEVPGQHAMGVPVKQATRVPEQQVIGVPEQQVTGVPEQLAEEVPEQRMEWGSMVEEARPSSQDTGNDHKATAGGSSRHR